MTNNPTIDGVSRRMLTALLHHVSELVNRALVDELRAILDAPAVENGVSRAEFEREVQRKAERFQPDFRRCGDNPEAEYKDSTLQWAYELCQAMRSTAPAVERQEPEYPAGAIHNGRAFIDQLESIYAFKEQKGHPLSLCSEWQELVRCFEWLATHATEAQSTIACLEARITQLESEKEFAAATYQAARDRIAELESGRGERK